MVADEKTYMVGTLGLQKQEERFVKIMLGLTSHPQSKREQGRYEWSDDSKRLDVMIVNSEDDEAIQQWHKLASVNPAVTLLLVTASEQSPLTRYCMTRPFGPAKVLMLLDRIIKERGEKKSAGGAEVEAFAGSSRSSQREAGLTKVPRNVRHRALVVDDSPTVRKQLVLELGSFNIQVDTAETGEQGLEMLAGAHYDIVFLDVVMPGADGYQVCKTLRRDSANKNTPVVMLTSKSSPFDKVRGSLAGCNSYLTKPVEYDNFYQVLEEFLAQSGGMSTQEYRSAENSR